MYLPHTRLESNPSFLQKGVSQLLPPPLPGLSLAVAMSYLGGILRPFNPSAGRASLVVGEPGFEVFVLRVRVRDAVGLVLEL